MNCSCCDTGIYNNTFSLKMAAKELKKFNKSGPNKSSRKLIATLKKDISKGGTTALNLLDIGSGIGSIPLSLTSVGLSKISSIDISDAYQEVLKIEIKKSSENIDVEFYLGDFIGHSAKIEVADIVTLDKVICCYKDYRQLIEQSVNKSSRYYGIIIPRNTWWVKFGNNVGILFRKLFGTGFVTYIHPLEKIEKIIFDNNFSRIINQYSFEWQILLYQKN